MPLILIALLIAIAIPVLLLYLSMTGHGALIRVVARQAGYYGRLAHQHIMDRALAMKQIALDPLMRQFGWLVAGNLLFGTLLGMWFAGRASAYVTCILILICGAASVFGMVRVLRRPFEPLPRLPQRPHRPGQPPPPPQPRYFSVLEVLVWAIRINLAFGALLLFVFAPMARDGSKFSVIADARAIAMLGALFVAIGCSVIATIGYLIAAGAKATVDLAEFTLDRLMLIISGTLLGNKDDLKKITNPATSVANIANQEQFIPALQGVFRRFANIFIPLCIIQVLCVSPMILLAAIFFGGIGEYLYQHLRNNGEKDEMITEMKRQGAWRFIIVAYILLVAAVIPMLFPSAVTKIDLFGQAVEALVTNLVGFIASLVGWVADFFGGKVVLALTSTKYVWFRLIFVGILAFVAYPKATDKDWRLTRKLCAIPMFAVAGHALIIVMVVGFWNPPADAMTVRGDFIYKKAQKPTLTVKDDAVMIEWRSVTGADGYTILRRDEASTAYQPITPLKAPLGKSITHFVDHPPPGKYYYQFGLLYGSSPSEPSDEQLVVMEKPKAANGAACTADSDCLSGRCKSSVCKAPPSHKTSSGVSSSSTAHVAAAGNPDCKDLDPMIAQYTPGCNGH